MSNNDAALTREELFTCVKAFVDDCYPFVGYRRSLTGGFAWDWYAHGREDTQERLSLTIEVQPNQIKSERHKEDGSVKYRRWVRPHRVVLRHRLADGTIGEEVSFNCHPDEALIGIEHDGTPRVGLSILLKNVYQLQHV